MFAGACPRCDTIAFVVYLRHHKVRLTDVRALCQENFGIARRFRELGQIHPCSCALS
jgi:hypothetical protein